MTQSNAKAVHEGFHTSPPPTVIPGAAQATQWDKQALGAKARGLRSAVPGGQVMSMERWFGDSAVMLADEFPDMQVLSHSAVGGPSTVLNILTQDGEVLWQRAVQAGAQVVHPLSDTCWGGRQGQITDPFGQRWGLAQQVRAVPPEEVARRAWVRGGVKQSRGHDPKPKGEELAPYPGVLCACCPFGKTERWPVFGQMAPLSFHHEPWRASCPSRREKEHDHKGVRVTPRGHGA